MHITHAVKCHLISDNNVFIISASESSVPPPYAAWYIHRQRYFLYINTSVYCDTVSSRQNTIKPQQLTRKTKQLACGRCMGTNPSQDTYQINHTCPLSSPISAPTSPSWPSSALGLREPWRRPRTRPSEGAGSGDAPKGHRREVCSGGSGEWRRSVAADWLRGG